MLTHSKFILTPISSILKDAVNALSGISCGIETYPMAEYIFQSIFLKMTGALEQKLKCICWDIATNDYEYRYEYLKKKYSEYSSASDKKNVMNDLCGRIIHLDSGFNFMALIPDKKTFLNNSINEVVWKMESSLLSQWHKKDFDFFYNHPGFLIEKQISFSSKKHFISLGENFWNDYDNIVYKHRNRCAHNLESYQLNLPTLSKLVSDRYEYENYFYRFSIIVLLDNIYMILYNKYQEALNSSI